MPRALSELHDNVKNGRSTSRGPLDRINITNQNIAVKFLLHCTHSSVQNRFMFWWKILFDFLFQTTEHERSQDFVKLRNELVFLIIVVDVEVEPFIELLSAGKHIWN